MVWIIYVRPSYFSLVFVPRISKKLVIPIHPHDVALARQGQGRWWRKPFVSVVSAASYRGSTLRPNALLICLPHMSSMKGLLGAASMMSAPLTPAFQILPRNLLAETSGRWNSKGGDSFRKVWCLI